MSKAFGVHDLDQDGPFQSDVPDGTIVIANSIDSKNVISMANARNLKQLVQRENICFDQEMALSRSMVLEPHLFLQDPLSAILGDDPFGGLQTLRVSCSATDSKRDALQQLESFLKALRGARMIRDEALLVADEMFTNGAKNAGNFYAKLQPDQPTQDFRPGLVEFVARADADRLVIGVIDTFGELDVNVIVRKIHGCFENGVAQAINMGPGGAGIGSFLIFNSCCSLYLAVEKKVKTVVCCALPLARRMKETVNLPKNIHIMSFDNDKGEPK